MGLRKEFDKMVTTKQVRYLRALLIGATARKISFNLKQEEWEDIKLSTSKHYSTHRTYYWDKRRVSDEIDFLLQLGAQPQYHGYVQLESSQEAVDF